MDILSVLAADHHLRVVDEQGRKHENPNAGVDQVIPDDENREHRERERESELSHH